MSGGSTVSWRAADHANQRRAHTSNRTGTCAENGFGGRLFTAATGSTRQSIVQLIPRHSLAFNSMENTPQCAAPDIIRLLPSPRWVCCNVKPNLNDIAAGFVSLVHEPAKHGL